MGHLEADESVASEQSRIAPSFHGTFEQASMIRFIGPRLDLRADFFGTASLPAS